MTFRSRLNTFLLQCLLLLCLVAPVSLKAQLDPRLQVSSTDFLDLYQQSSNALVKPEIMTLFDFSGSMLALMFHPAYRNIDINDTNYPGQTITFTLAQGNTASEVYVIRATSRQDPRVYSQMTVTVGGATSLPTKTGPNYVRSGDSGDRRYLYTSISSLGITPSGTISGGTTYTFSAAITLACNTSKDNSTPSKPLSEWMSRANVTTLDGGIDWTVTGNPAAASGTTNAAPSSYSVNTWTSASQTFQWTAPVGVAVPGSVTASFSSFNATCNELIKPNGMPVTYADALAASTTLNGGSAAPKDADVRNWVRAASHARFTYNDDGTTRTVDIPIPWKVMDMYSTGNPLSSTTVSDPTTSATNPDGTTTSYGSGRNIEVDQAYKIRDGDEILNVRTTSGGNATSVRLQHTGYQTPYLTFLFTGKYANGPYANKYIVYDAADASIVGGQSLATWGQGFGIGIPTGTTLVVPSYGEALNGVTRPYLGTVTVDAASYVVPSRTRVQAVKEAAINSWVKYQNRVMWAFRYIGDGGSDQNQNSMSISSSATLHNTATTLDTVPTSAVYGTDTGWTLLNGNSVAGMQRISYMLENTNTPLTYAVSSAMAQFCDPNNVFNSIETAANKPSQCMTHFLILFTDGADNVGTLTNTSPYLDPTTLQGNAWDGNKNLLLNTTGVNQGVTGPNYWNLYTFAAIGAHLSDSSVKDGAGASHYMAIPATGYPPTSSGTRSTFLPYSITSRGSGTNLTKFVQPHRITTMAVGVSLGGTYLDPNSPKYRLLAAAAIGDPTTLSWNLNNLLPFDSVPDPNDSSRLLRKSGTTNFFDGSNPETLKKSLDVAIQQALLPSNVNTTSNPELPYIGAALGQQIYLGKFKPPANGGVIWSGDLLMFGSRQVDGKTLVIDNTNNPATLVDTSTAVWATSTALSARPWYQRKLFTRIPGNSQTPEYGLSLFSDIDLTSAHEYSSSSTGLKNFVATSNATDPTRQHVIQFAAGGDTTGTMSTSLNSNGRPVSNRPNLMGDIVNSSPGVLEYNYSQIQSSLPSRLKNWSGTSTNSNVPNRFRLLLVGTNQGWLHAFGEVSNITTTNGVNQVNGAVDELWAFMPTDFLANLDYTTQAGNSHQFMVDGTPSIYFLDLPPSTGGIGNGKLDWGTTGVTQTTDVTQTKERAIAIIGLRKGGRSYYALDIHDPFNPTLKWSLVADEAANFPSTRIPLGGPSLSTVQSILANWGFSTCTPALGRIMFNGVLRDAVFLGGGLSLPEVEANFMVNSVTPQMGRSIIALDAYTGEILAAVDMSSSGSPTASASIPAGLVPFEFFLNSGMAQRAYFLDYKGGLWSWGQQTTVTSATAYQNYRTDSSDITNWSVRKVAQDGTGKNALYSTLPAPFRVGTFPGQGKSGTPSPAVVGIATISGDRNNRLDYSYTTNKPAQHRLTVIFDRQDHKAWDSSDSAITDSSLLDAYPSNSSIQAGDPLITPGTQSYYLAPHDASGNYSTPKLGYYRYLPAASGSFIAKGINSPLVVAGALFYSFFSPEAADPCTGGAGKTYASLICDALNPIVTDSRTNVSCTSGTQFTWTGVASDFVTIGTQGVLQAGVIPAINPAPGQSLTTIQLQTILGNRLERFPKVRTWRTIH
ncbi:MAG: hypothetical protein WCK63_14820 [Betaproteobacteria bacterium]